MAAVRRFRMRPRSGIATTEFALVLPLLLLLTLSLLEYGWLFLKAQQITNAARQGARIGARVDATASDVTAAIDDMMTAYGLGGSGYTVVIDPESIDTLDPGEMLSVTVSVTYANIGMNMPLTPTPTSLSSTTTMVREGT